MKATQSIGGGGLGEREQEVAAGAGSSLPVPPDLTVGRIGVELMRSIDSRGFVDLVPSISRVYIQRIRPRI